LGAVFGAKRQQGALEVGPVGFFDLGQM
jgi:hypothetical protein